MGREGVGVLKSRPRFGGIRARARRGYSKTDGCIESGKCVAQPREDERDGRWKSCERR